MDNLADGGSWMVSISSPICVIESVCDKGQSEEPLEEGSSLQAGRGGRESLLLVTGSKPKA